ncbi:myb-like protein Q [Tigriopus californicus]|uniref:myb-like protein Q n=1 Tax=Tigriopus californicus TaxID=6832 RepID=UPI0027DA72DB|nr:myb-like protein Q [Tigriopus californicus]
MPERTGIVTRSGHICMICGHIPTTKNKYRELQDHLVRKHFNERIKAALPTKRPYLCPEPHCKIEGKDWQALMRHYTGKHGVLETYLRQIIDSGMALPPNPKHSRAKAKQDQGQAHIAPTQEQIDEILTTKLDPNVPVHVAEKVGKPGRRKRPSHNSTGSSCGQESNQEEEEENDEEAPQYALVIKRTKTGEDSYHLLDLKSLLAYSRPVPNLTTTSMAQLPTQPTSMISPNSVAMPPIIPSEPIPLPELVQAQQMPLNHAHLGSMSMDPSRPPNVVFSQAHQQLVVSHHESKADDPLHLEPVAVEDLSPTVYQHVFIQSQDPSDVNKFQFQTQPTLDSASNASQSNHHQNHQHPQQQHHHHQPQHQHHQPQHQHHQQEQQQQQQQQQQQHQIVQEPIYVQQEDSLLWIPLQMLVSPTITKTTNTRNNSTTTINHSTNTINHSTNTTNKKDSLQQAMKQIYIPHQTDQTEDDQGSYIVHQDSSGQILGSDGLVYLSADGIPLQILNQSLQGNEQYQIVQTVQELEEETGQLSHLHPNEVPASMAQVPASSLEERVIVEEVQAIPVEETSSAEDRSASNRVTEALGIVASSASSLVSVTASNLQPKMAEKEAVTVNHNNNVSHNNNNNNHINNNNDVEGKLDPEEGPTKELKAGPDGVKELEFSMF